MGLLSDEMQKRLDEWRKATQKDAPKVQEKPQKAKNYVSRRDYGDEIDDQPNR
jgi:hypothetical protein